MDSTSFYLHFRRVSSSAAWVNPNPDKSHR